MESAADESNGAVFAAGSGSSPSFESQVVAKAAAPAGGRGSGAAGAAFNRMATLNLAGVGRRGIEGGGGGEAGEAVL